MVVAEYRKVQQLRELGSAGSALRLGSSPNSRAAPNAPTFLTGVLATFPTAEAGTVASSRASSSA